MVVIPIMDVLYYAYIIIFTLYLASMIQRFMNFAPNAMEGIDNQCHVLYRSIIYGDYRRVMTW